ncbi:MULTISPECIES: ATP-binding cassette domain-containing protein [Enterococcus]|uniref:ATP-binding cassette domain-containing protein n=1 Tax=Enterococcus TaxID=1350 RepID=UPI0010F9E7FA|nr:MULTISPECIES: ATP-binding cassette domain-containing protein [Enterococcus]KAF1301754.1 peptide ABC transporter ATP-binding protein [Enterococcus sp. JM9B]
MNELIRIEKANKIFVKKSLLKNSLPIHAINQADLTIYQGETVGLVGESGSGKTTLGRSILQLETLTSGDIYFKGVNLTQANKNQRQKAQKDMQIIYQDPYSSLNPNLTALQLVMEPLELQFSSAEAKKRAMEVLALVGFTEEDANKLPFAFSGGQRQRIGIARAVATNPEFILCDEPISALDVSIQAQIINLLVQLQKKFSLTYLFISHDLSMVRYISDRIVVMYQGKILEVGPAEELFINPQHAYTKKLLRAIPEPDPKKARKNFSEMVEDYRFDEKKTQWTEVSEGHFYAKEIL